MTRRRIATTFITLIVTASLAACNLQLVAPSADQAATQTLAALATQVQATLVGVPTEVPSDTPVPPAEAPDTPVPTLSPTVVSLTAHVDDDTHCRTGPGVVYDKDYTAPAGTDLDIVGRSSVPEYVIVEVPGEPGHTCWLWTRYVTVIGDISSLPVSTPPPTPTPTISFKVTYSYMEGCVGWDPGFKVENTGSVTFHSARVQAEDTTTATTVTDSTDVFDKRTGCAVGTSIPELAPGATGYVYANSFIYDPTGNAFEATLKLCTGAGLTGTCVSKTITFTP